MEKHLWKKPYIITLLMFDITISFPTLDNIFFYSFKENYHLYSIFSNIYCVSFVLFTKQIIPVVRSPTNFTFFQFMLNAIFPLDAITYKWAA